MIRLILMRHANALDGSVDRTRPLSREGRSRAQRVAIELKRLGWTPDRIIHSDATRCVQTVAAMIPIFGDAAAVDSKSVLYLAAPETIDSVIAGADPTDGDSNNACLMIVAHNPGLSVAASHWSGQYQSLRPAGSVRLTIDADQFADATPPKVVQFDSLDAGSL